MSVQGISARDFFDLARFAWLTYENVRRSRENFANLNLDVECLLITVGGLDKGHTGRLVADYIDGEPLSASDGRDAGFRPTEDLSQRQVEVRALRDGLHSVIFPFYAFLEKHTRSFPEAGNSDDDRGIKLTTPNQQGRRPTLRPLDRGSVDLLVGGTDSSPYRAPSPERRAWLKLPVWVRRLYTSFDLRDMNEIRSRFAVQAANLNLFLTRLTHNQLQKQTELLTLRLTEDKLLGGNWEYSRDLKIGDTKFRQDVAAYVHHLLNGGQAFTEQDLRRKAVEDKYAQRRREERLWAEEKIAEEDRLRRKLENPERVSDPAGPRRSSPRIERYSSDRWEREEFQLELRDRRRDSLVEGRERSRGSRSRSPLEAALDPIARKCLYEARRRIEAAETAGLLDNEISQGQGIPSWQQPPFDSSSSEREQKKDSYKRHSSPGITITTVPSNDGSPRASEPTLSSPSRSRPGEGMQRTRSTSGSGTGLGTSPGISATVRPTDPVGSTPMQHSFSASPRMRPTTPLRTVSTPGAVVPPPQDSGTPVTESKIPTVVRTCNQCNARIHLDEWFYKCATGDCAENNSYDLCRKCYGRGYRCRGRDSGKCPPMICMAIKPRETEAAKS